MPRTGGTRATPSARELADQLCALAANRQDDLEIDLGIEGDGQQMTLSHREDGEIQRASAELLVDGLEERSHTSGLVELRATEDGAKGRGKFVLVPCDGDRDPFPVGEQYDVSACELVDVFDGAEEIDLLI